MKALTEDSIFSRVNYNRQGYGTQQNQPINTQTAPYQNPALNVTQMHNIGAIEVDYCASLHPWQQQIVNELRTQQDIYILSQPGSGKTPPVICHWVNNILHISTNPNIPTNDQVLINLLEHPENIPQILWLVPIKNLAANIEQEMIERFTAILLQIINRVCGINKATGEISFPNINPTLSIDNIIDALGKHGDRNSKQILMNMIGQNHSLQTDQIADFKTILGRLVKSFVSNALVGRIEEKTNTVTIDKRHQHYKPCVISIYESAKHVIGHLNDLKLLIFDEAQRVQGGTPEDDIRAQQIGDSVHKVLFNKNGRKAQLIMLSGSTSKVTASNVIHYFNLVYGRKFKGGPYSTPETATNPSDIRVFPLSGLNDPYTQLRIAQTALARGDGGILFIIFGKERINQMIDKLAPTEKGYIHPGGKLPTSRGSLYDFKTDVGTITKPGDITDISDERLRRAASNGIGYLYRPINEITPQQLHDTMIVQNLFRAGLIKILFATDAVREGINITCKEIYIPTILKPPGNTEISMDALAQLVNRVGRKPNKYATVYTDPKFIGKISQALSTNPKFENQPFILPKGKLNKLEIGLNYGINIPIETSKEIGRGILKIFF